MVDDPGCLAPIFRLINLEVGKKGGRLFREEFEHCHRAPPDFQLRSFARPDLEPRPPGSRVRGHDDFRLSGIGQDSSGRRDRGVAASIPEAAAGALAVAASGAPARRDA